MKAITHPSATVTGGWGTPDIPGGGKGVGPRLLLPLAAGDNKVEVVSIVLVFIA